VEYPEPTLYAAPAFVAAMLVEHAVLKSRRPQTGRGYEKRDTLASLWMAVGSLAFVALNNFVVFRLATWLYPHRIISLGGPLAFVFAIIGWDFLFYWHHRAEHRVRLLWACHVNHHSSEHFNFSTALRQPWTPFATLLFYPSLALVGVQPSLIMLSGGINLVYQFWVHTEAIGKLPAPIEWLLNTPSHHRVHHASNPRYLDKNYAGIFMLWDRLFGSFEPETEPVRYGITTNIGTFNPFRIAFHEYIAMAEDVFRPKTSERASLRARLRAVFAPPGS
jgi:sterol desaturase/sphingolipid hydroxylase (fatty acid hydroxylase superfamily)